MHRARVILHDDMACMESCLTLLLKTVNYFVQVGMWKKANWQLVTQPAILFSSVLSLSLHICNIESEWVDGHSLSRWSYKLPWLLSTYILLSNPTLFKDATRILKYFWKEVPFIGRCIPSITYYYYTKSVQQILKVFLACARKQLSD